MIDQTNIRAPERPQVDRLAIVPSRYQGDILDVQIDSQKIRYLLAGGWNTMFGYSLGVSLYMLLSPSLNTFLIAVLANLIAISMSFIIYKVFVFRTTGEWMREYLRSYVSYGSAAVLGVFLFWFLVDVFGMNIWLTQFLCIIMTATASYFANKYYTFKRSK